MRDPSRTGWPAPQKYRDVLSGVEFADLQRRRAYSGTLEKPGPIFKVASRASAI
jgi:hypothetical protein